MSQSIGALLLFLLSPQEKGMKELIELLGRGEAEVRDGASQEILSRWKRWSLEDLDTLAEAGPGDVEIAGRAREALSRIRIRRAVGETLLKTVGGLESALRTKNEDGLIEALDQVEQLSRKNGVDGADVVSLLRLISEQKWTDRVDERVRALAKSGLIADPKQVLPMLKEEDPMRRMSALETLARLRARPLADQIVPLLKDSNPDVRREAAKALGTLRSRQEGGRIAILLQERSPDARARAAELLGNIGAQDKASLLLPLLKDQVLSVRRAALHALAKLRARDLAGQVVPLLADINPAVRRDAVDALGALEAAGEVPQLEALLRSKDPAARASAADALGELGKGGPTLVPLLKDSDAEVRRQAARSLGKGADRSISKELRPLLEDEDHGVRGAAIESLGRLGAKGDTERVASYAKDKDPLLREKAIEALGRMGAAGLSKVFQQALNDPEGRVRAAALRALGRLPGGGSLEAAQSLVGDPDPAVREQAVERLGYPDAGAFRVNVRDLLQDTDPRVRRRAVETLEASPAPEDLAEIARLLEDPIPWVRARAALAIGRQGALLGSAAERERLTYTLRAVERDPEWQVEVAAGIGLIHLGAKDPAAQKRLVDELLATGAASEAQLTYDLLDALGKVHEKECRETFVRARTLEAELDSVEGFRQFLKGAGIVLDPTSLPWFRGNLVKGSVLSPREVVERALFPKATCFSGRMIYLQSRGDALEFWRKRLKE